MKFIIYMTGVINETAPLNFHDQPIFSTGWSPQLQTNMDDIFTVESRYSFYRRKNTVVSISLTEVLYFVHNIQEPIARRSEIIFRNLLFTIVVLEVFRLAFLLLKIFFMPLVRLVTNYISKKKMQNKSTVDETDETEMNDPQLNTVQTDIGERLYLTIKHSVKDFQETLTHYMITSATLAY